MSNDIKITKGLDIKLKGEAEKALESAVISNTYTLRPEDFHGVIPKLVARVGDKVKAGSPVFYDKSNENVQFVSPVSGEVVDILRGEKRKILAIKIQADKEQSYLENEKINVNSATAEALSSYLQATGCWPFIKQRPYDVIANPTKQPKAIFVSGYDSAPLAVDLDFALQGKEAELQAAVTALGKLTSGQVHVSVKNGSNSPLAGLSGVSLHKLSGPHPVGNVGTQINKIDPVNKGEVVWTINPQDLVIIGELLLTGKFNAERIVALVGSVVKKPRYFKTKVASEIATIIYDNGIDQKENNRVIVGNVLSGKQVKPDGNLDYYSNLITVIPEGDDYEFFGWNKPVFNKISTSRALTFSWLSPNKKYDLNTNTNGEHRAFVLTGNYEEVFPLDIFPMQILKSCMYTDLDEMEALGMYEVAPEDFALTEFVCVSKQPHQEIIRKGLDVMIKEIG
ncbi:Na(+)-translocating NADH-quinone reductase subunit A [Formosa algae]|uniref:Na(+)-translocating NADH-quinone reductase subunit A n=1 Tax=Formosa algae TaxID=225843 RepID=A0A9X1C8U7_9FLAO|nr:Na(+)-translocating NADH-quinone reductase subunit A [Formosa algae]MBP1839073.1 Na+-transporting NADH:ubiquinone oxidoreductase subunit A [Formosa algae]MDQ0333850.1 Na+-transporting NADH:ubiquinone oxidoreductase subunit A [Formosa algae]OEI80910.1 NADH:ubiquinone reductase (Na(+)-transporting) subunit A [Formosa algae]PNW26790.1 NADH:ubiquinone reductase (Na(+)-transporting) subunit A [Formosa algae]